MPRALLAAMLVLVGGIGPSGRAMAQAEGAASPRKKARDLFDYAAMIPLRSHKYRGNNFCLSLTGGAIRGDVPFEVHFDTGSWPTCLPYGCLDKSKLTVLEKDVRDCWGKHADVVRGPLAVKSTDGKTLYTVDDFVFYARKKPNGEDADCNRTSKWTAAIVGGLPGIGPVRKWPSLPYAMALKYSKPGRVGLGIVSDVQSGPSRDWLSGRSYLQIGSDPRITRNLHWRTDVPIHPERFSPGALPGFTITFRFPKTNDVAVPDIVVPNLSATIDTGAPELMLRLRSDDPHRSDLYKRFFSDEGPGWRRGQGKADSLCLRGGVTVQIAFTDSRGETTRCEFLSIGNFNSPNPTKVMVGDWLGIVPWRIRPPEKPPGRFNLGNTLYLFCPVYFWDITNRRVGLHDFM